MALDSSIPLVFNTHDRKLMMATLSELVEAVATAEGMDPATVALIARYAREGGFIQKKGRGPSAAQMSVRDAANLLIAVNASGAARDAAVVVPLYRNLINIEYFGADGKNIQKNYVFFGDLLELVIQAAIDGRLPETFRPDNLPIEIHDAFQRENVSISVTFRRPELRGQITIGNFSTLEDGMGMSSVGVPFFFVPRRGRQSRALLKMKSGDRTDETNVGGRTIFSVARTLRSSPQYERTERKA